MKSWLVMWRCVLVRDGSGGECWQVVSSDLGVVGGDDVDSAADERVEAEVAAAFGPFVGLLGQAGPTRQTMASRVGKLPTASLRRRISTERSGIDSSTIAAGATNDSPRSSVSSGCPC